MSSRSSGGKTIPSLTTPTPLAKQPATTKEGFTYRHCITSMPKIDCGQTIPQFNTAQQHFLPTTKCICSKNSMYNTAYPTPVVLPLLILIYPLLLSLSPTHRQPPVAESMGVTWGNLTTILEHLTNLGINIPKATIEKGNHYLSSSDQSYKVI